MICCLPVATRLASGGGGARLLDVTVWAHHLGPGLSLH